MCLEKDAAQLTQLTLTQTSTAHTAHTPVSASHKIASGIRKARLQPGAVHNGSSETVYGIYGMSWGPHNHTRLHTTHACLLCPPSSNPSLDHPLSLSLSLCLHASGGVVCSPVCVCRGVSEGIVQCPSHLHCRTPQVQRAPAPALVLALKGEDQGTQALTQRGGEGGGGGERQPPA